MFHTEKDRKQKITKDRIFVTGEVNLSTFSYQYEHWQRTDKFQLQEL